MNIACVAFAFGVPSNTEANQRIASMACGIKITSYPGIYTQRDVDITPLKKAGFRNRMQVTYTVERLGYPPPTLRIARGAVDWAMTNNVSTLIIYSLRLSTFVEMSTRSKTSYTRKESEYHNQNLP